MKKGQCLQRHLSFHKHFQPTYSNQIIQVFCKENYTPQKSVGKYSVDLYFPDYNLAIECDEHNHTDRNAIYEKNKQKYIENNLGAKFLRFNPDDNNFNILDIISQIHYHIKSTSSYL